MKSFSSIRFANMNMILLIMLAFGLVMGLVFPFVVDPFVTWNPDRKLFFRLACLIAGLAVGSFCYAIIKLTLYQQKVELERAKDKFTTLTEAAIRKRDWNLELAHPQIPTCWRILPCNELKCPVFGKEHLRCWLIAGTFCNGKVQGRFAEKLRSCTLCNVYKQSVKQNPMMEIAENFNSLMSVVSERESQLADANRQLQEMAVTDSLTGIKNHGFFQERLHHELARAKRFNRRMSLVMVDLDHFKRVNDRFGHQTGDMVLKWVSQFMESQLREIDMIARYGGEEFAIILPDTSGLDGVKLAEKLRVLLKEKMPAEVGIPSSYVGGSFGVADFPICAQDENALIKASDSALLRSKRLGRNRVTYYLHLNDAPLPAAGSGPNGKRKIEKAG